MESFISEELQKLGETQTVLQDKVSAFESSEKEVVSQTSSAKEDMNSVLEEIKVLREDVKQKVGEGLNGLSSAAGRISAEVINELGLFHTQVGLSPSISTHLTMSASHFLQLPRQRIQDHLRRPRQTH